MGTSTNKPCCENQNCSCNVIEKESNLAIKAWYYLLGFMSGAIGIIVLIWLVNG